MTRKLSRKRFSRRLAPKLSSIAPCHADDLTEGESRPISGSWAQAGRRFLKSLLAVAARGNIPSHFWKANQNFLTWSRRSSGRNGKQNFDPERMRYTEAVSATQHFTAIKKFSVPAIYTPDGSDSKEKPQQFLKPKRAPKSTGSESQQNLRGENNHQQRSLTASSSPPLLSPSIASPCATPARRGASSDELPKYAERRKRQAI